MSYNYKCNLNGCMNIKLWCIIKRKKNDTTIYNHEIENIYDNIVNLIFIQPLTDVDQKINKNKTKHRTESYFQLSALNLDRFELKGLLIDFSPVH